MIKIPQFDWNDLGRWQMRSLKAIRDEALLAKIIDSFNDILCDLFFLELPQS